MFSEFSLTAVTFVRLTAHARFGREHSRAARRSAFERALSESRGHDPDPGDDGTTLSSRRWPDVMNDRRYPGQKT